MPRIMPTDLADELKRDRRSASRDYAGSLMSNAKWRTAVEALAHETIGLRQVIVKFVNIHEEHRLSLPWQSLAEPFAYTGSFGAVPWVGIEWLEVPAEAVVEAEQGIPARRFAQDVPAVRQALEATGKHFRLEETPRGLRLIGHVKGAQSLASESDD